MLCAYVYAQMQRGAATAGTTRALADLCPALLALYRMPGMECCSACMQCYVRLSRMHAHCYAVFCWCLLLSCRLSLKTLAGLHGSPVQLLRGVGRSDMLRTHTPIPFRPLISLIHSAASSAL